MNILVQIFADKPAKIYDTGRTAGMQSIYNWGFAEQ